MEQENKNHKNNFVQKKLTPRQLVNKLIQNKDYQISDKEFKDLDITVKVKERGKKKKS